MKIVVVVQARVGSTPPAGQGPAAARWAPHAGADARARRPRGALDDVVVATTPSRGRRLDRPARRRLPGALHLGRSRRSARPPPAGARARPGRRRRQDPVGLPADRSGGHRPGRCGFFRAHAERYDYVEQPPPRDLARRQRRRGHRLDALETTAREATRPFEREHTTPFIWDQPERFAIGNVAWETGRDLSRPHRLTLDYEEDYQLISRRLRRAAPRGFGRRRRRLRAALQRRGNRRLSRPPPRGSGAERRVTPASLDAETTRRSCARWRPRRRPAAPTSDDNAAAWETPERLRRAEARRCACAST